MTIRLLVALGALAAGCALAQPARDHDFAALDADESGGISLAEVHAIAPDVTRRDFSRYDSDASGELSQTEFAVFAAERGA